MKRYFLLSAIMLTSLTGCIFQQNTPPQPNAGAVAAAQKTNIVSKTVLAGKTSSLGGIFTVNPDCTPKEQQPVIRVTQQPTHGSLAVVQRPDYPTYPTYSPNAACNKVKVPGTFLDYTPQAGFTGSDVATIEIFFTATGNYAERKLLITVK